MSDLLRPIVLVLGDAPVLEEPFGERDLILKRATPDNAVNFFNEARAILVADFAGRFKLISECYTGLFRQAEDYGLVLLTVAQSTQDFVQIEAIKRGADPESPARVLLAEKPGLIAEYIRRFAVKPAVGEAKIDPETNLSTSDLLLIRRAFWDCTKALLEPLPGGKGSVFVFRAHAWLKQSEVGPRPLPFFVKIAKPNVIAGEIDNYKRYAEHYIPFNLRPNLDYNRCIEARERSILVGNFVDNALPLRQSLRVGHGISALSGLFETTLGGFRSQPFIAGRKPDPLALRTFVQHRIWAKDIPAAIIDRARARGLTTAPSTMESKLCAAAEEHPCITGPYHGDLHSGNVMTRSGDAIVIDFSLTDHAPLTADPAALEVSLIFGTDADDRADCFDDWRGFVDRFYPVNGATLHPIALYEDQPGEFSWLSRALRALRHVLLGCTECEPEARIVLAAYLMRFARLGNEEVPDKLINLATDRHAYALVVAERILESLNKK